MDVKTSLHSGIQQLKYKEAAMETELLLLHAWNKDRAFLYSHFQEEVPKAVLDRFYQYLATRKRGVPLSYITHEKNFFTLSLYVDERVLIPRPETELLVEKSVEYLVQRDSPKRVLDMCAGSGAISIAIANSCLTEVIHAADIETGALEVAQRNIEKYSLETRIRCIHSDFFSQIPDAYDLIVSNPPYIPTQMIEQCSSDVQQEPRIALDGGLDGLSAIRRLIKESTHHLQSKSLLLFEICGDFQVPAIQALFFEYGYSNPFFLPDLTGTNRICGGYYG